MMADAYRKAEESEPEMGMIMPMVKRWCKDAKRICTHKKEGAYVPFLHFRPP
jgi:hypothetical protein